MKIINIINNKTYIKYEEIPYFNNSVGFLKDVSNLPISLEDKSFSRFYRSVVKDNHSGIGGKSSDKNGILIIQNPVKLNEQSGYIHPEAKIDKSAVIDASAIIGDCTIGKNVVIGKNCVVGDKSVLLGDMKLEAGVFIGRENYINTGGIIGKNTFILNNNIIYDNRNSSNHYHDYFIEDNVIIGHRNTINSHIKIEKHVYIQNDCTVVFPGRVGAGACIDSGCTISPYADIGMNSYIRGNLGIEALVGNNSFIKTNIPNRCHIGDNVEMFWTTLGYNCTIKNGVSVSVGGAIGNNCEIGAGTKVEQGCYIQDNVTIGRNNEIRTGVVLRDSVKIGNDNIIGAVSEIGTRAQLHSNINLGHHGYVEAEANIEDNSKIPIESSIKKRNVKDAFENA